MTTLLRLMALALVLVGASACKGPGHVEFAGGQCLIDGRPANLQEVETRQARLSERILARQPIQVAITIFIVLLAGASHIEKLLVLFNTKKTHAQGLGERIRMALDRYRRHPLRYFVIIFSTLILLGVAAGAYVYLDADKRASERALGLLQFCHLALRNDEAQGILAEQRRNLTAIESTAGNIRKLVDKLPPEEQQKAREIVQQINTALAKQGTLVNDWLTKNDEATREAKEHSQLLERGISSVEANLSALKVLPAALKDVSDQLKTSDGKLQSGLAAEGARLDAIKSTLDALAARPACPACNCESRPAAAVSTEKPDKIEKADKPEKTEKAEPKTDKAEKVEKAKAALPPAAKPDGGAPPVAKQ